MLVKVNAQFFQQMTCFTEKLSNQLLGLKGSLLQAFVFFSRLFAHTLYSLATSISTSRHVFRSPDLGAILKLRP